MANNAARADFGNAVKKARKEIDRNWNQEKCSERINEKLPKGCKNHFNQKKISRIELGDETLHLTDTEIKAIAETLNLEDSIVAPVLQELYADEEIKPSPSEISISEGGQIICSASHQELQSYFGNYNCIYFSTDSSVKEIVHGSLHIRAGKNAKLPCVARLTIFDQNGIPIKWYSGPFVINRHYRTWHCILIGHDKQEVCMLTASHFNATVHTNIMNIALAITTSAGTQKRPTVHRLLIYRNELSKMQLKLLTSQLRLNTDSILISEQGLNELESIINKYVDGSFEKRVLTDCLKLIHNEATEIRYFRLDESLIYDSTKINCDKKMKSWAISQIRSCTDREYYNKLSQTVHDICVNIMEMDI